MSNNVEKIHPEVGENRRPSDVFLALFRWYTIAADADSETFRVLADTWAQIRALEAEALREKVLPIAEAMSKVQVVAAPTGADLTSSVGCADTFSSRGRQDAEEAPVSDPDLQRNGKTKEDNAEIGNRSFATRKRNVLARIEELRSAGVTYAQIADAGPGLTLNSVLDAVNRKPLPLVSWTALEKAVKALAKQRPLPAAPMKGD